MISTATIEAELRQFLSTAYSLLFQRYVLFTVAMIVSAIIIPVFIVKIVVQYEKKHTPKAYLYRGTTKLGIHYTILALLLAVAGRNVYQSVQLAKSTEIYDNGIIWLSGLLMILAFAAVFFLFEFRARGLIMAGIFVVFYAVYRQYLLFQKVGELISISENYNIVFKYGGYYTVDFLTEESMIISFLAVIILVLIVLYYYKRRFLFTPGKIGLPSCGYCGKAICKGDNFCTNCGVRLSVNPVKQTILPLDGERRCRKCGKNINEYGCKSCDSVEVLKKIAKEQVKKQRNSKIKKIVWGLILILGLMVPIFAEPVGDLEKEMTRINNAFVLRWDEFCDTPEKAADSEWLAGFDSDINALYIADARWYYIKPEIIPCGRLGYYAIYAEASFRQMEKLEQMKQLVHDVSSSEIVDADMFDLKITELTNGFNQTIAEQSMARDYYFIGNGDILEEFWLIVCNGIRYYTSGVNRMIMAFLILIVNMCMLIYLLNNFSTTMETGLERWSRQSDVKADKILQKYMLIYHPLISDNILHRVITALKNCGYSFIHSMCKLWVLGVRLICVIGLFLSLFRVRNIKRILLWLKNGLTDPGKMWERSNAYKEYKQRERILTAISVAIAAVILGVPIFIGMARMNKGEIVAPEEQYIGTASIAITGYSQEIMTILQRTARTKTLTEEEKEELYRLIDEQIAVDQEILEYDMKELGDYIEFHMGVCGLCEDDIKVLGQIKDSVNEGIVPSGELRQNYASIRGENYLWVIEELGRIFTEMSIEAVSDI